MRPYHDLDCCAETARRKRGLRRSEGCSLASGDVVARTHKLVGAGGSNGARFFRSERKREGQSEGRQAKGGVARLFSSSS
jgi:hypothetical protein